MAYQSLYRRYRPQKFAEIRGQPHIVSALQGAVQRDEVGHAYLFHGPRGTGKTTSARVLAKALNCENLGADAEPCGECESCVAIEEGRSFDLHELDAASNNGVDDMRDLIAKVNLGTPGRMKVYILDEVHMLSRGAENALLKTLEEPPDHVVWVLATTEPHKVVETIRSRCQVFELGLLGADEMTAHVRWVVDDAGLDVDDDAVAHVVAVGGGSVRDTLSALDRVVAAGGVVEIDRSTDHLLAALADHDTAAALAAVGDALGRGRDPRTIGEAALAGLRDAFLTAMGTPPPRLTEPDQERAAQLAGRMSPASMTRALDRLGTALVEMRQAPDPRVDLEVALVRLCRPETDSSLDAVLDRLQRLEQTISAGDAVVGAVPEPAPAPPPAAATAPAVPPPPAVAVDEPVDDAAPSAPRRGPAAAARKALADASRGPTAPQRGTATMPAASAAAPVPPPPAAPDLRAIRPESPSHVVRLAADHLGLTQDVVVARATELLGPSDGGRSAEELARLWVALIAEHEDGDELGEGQRAAPSPVDRVAVEQGVVEQGVVDEGVADHEPPPDDDIDLTDLVDAPDRADAMVERLTEAFPGAEVHTPEEPEQ